MITIIIAVCLCGLIGFLTQVKKKYSDNIDKAMCACWGSWVGLCIGVIISLIIGAFTPVSEVIETDVTVYNDNFYYVDLRNGELEPLNNHSFDIELVDSGEYKLKILKKDSWWGIINPQLILEIPNKSN